MENATAPPARVPTAVSNRPLPWGESVRILAGLGIRLAFQGKRTIFVALALAAPLALAIAWKQIIPVPRALASAEEFLMALTVTIYAMGVVPLVCLLFGTSVVSEEWEDKTLPYLFTRPVRKPAVVFGKALGMWLVSAALIAVSFAATGFVLWSKRIETDFHKHPALIFQTLGILSLSTLPYTAFFVFLGTVMRRPLIPALLFAFGLEKVLAFIPASVQRLSFYHYVRALLLPFDDVSHMLRGMEHEILRRVEQPSPAEAIAWLLGFTVFFAALSAWVVGRREYVFGKGD